MTTEAEKPEVTKKELSEAERIAMLTAIIEKAYPEKWNHVRKVPHLFDNFFRVNYFNIDNQNKIDESHFLEVVNEKIMERK